MRFGRAILDLRSGYVSGCGNAGRKDYLLHLLCPPPQVEVRADNHSSRLLSWVLISSCRKVVHAFFLLRLGVRHSFGGGG